MNVVTFSNGRRPEEHNLTDLQVAALRCIAEGNSVKQARDILGKRTTSTVQDTLNAAREKIGANHISHAVAIAYQRGILN